MDINSGAHRIFASGLHNPNGLAWGPFSGALWTVVNERDELGSDLVPDDMTSVRDGGFYGWPYSYYGQHIDARVTPQRPELVARAIASNYALGPHTASLGLASSAGTTLPAVFANGMFIGQHGSWNRRPHSGYKVIFVALENGRPAGAPVDVVTGFLSEDGSDFGRPVGKKARYVVAVFVHVLAPGSDPCEANKIHAYPVVSETSVRRRTVLLSGPHREALLGRA